VASDWSVHGDLVKGLESWCAQDIAERHLVDSLLKILQVRQMNSGRGIALPVPALEKSPALVRGRSSDGFGGQRHLAVALEQIC